MGVLLPRVQCKCCFFSSSANILLYICCMYQCSFCIPLLASHYYNVLRPEKKSKNVVIKPKAGLLKISLLQRNVNKAEEVCLFPQ